MRLWGMFKGAVFSAASLFLGFVSWGYYKEAKDSGKDEGKHEVMAGASAFAVVSTAIEALRNFLEECVSEKNRHKAATCCRKAAIALEGLGLEVTAVFAFAFAAHEHSDGRDGIAIGEVAVGTLATLQGLYNMLQACRKGGRDSYVYNPEDTDLSTPFRP